MRAVPPKSNATCFIGHKVKNVGGKWYISGGTFCCRCAVAFNFDESMQLYLRDKEMQRKHGIPRCLYCSQSVRTRSKPKNRSGFWEKIDKLRLEGKS